MAGRWSELPPQQPKWKQWRPTENRPHIHWAEPRPDLPPEMKPAIEWMERPAAERFARLIRSLRRPGTD